jgi:hypothetical protein
MRPKLVAIKVSGGHLVPVIMRASSRAAADAAIWTPRFRGVHHQPRNNTSAGPSPAMLV